MQNKKAIKLGNLLFRIDFEHTTAVRHARSLVEIKANDVQLNDEQRQFFKLVMAPSPIIPTFLILTSGLIDGKKVRLVSSRISTRVTGIVSQCVQRKSCTTTCNFIPFRSSSTSKIRIFVQSFNLRVVCRGKSLWECLLSMEH